MDVAGAKALQRRLNDPARAVRIAAPTAAVPEDAPPVYHWIGVAPIPADARPSGSEAVPDGARRSWRHRFGLSVF